MKVIDNNNDASVSLNEFPMLYKFLRMYERFYSLFREYDTSENMELELEEYVKFCWGIGIKDRTLAKKLF